MLRLRAAGIELGSNYPLPDRVPVVELNAAKAKLQEALSEVPPIEFPQKLLQMEVDQQPAQANGKCDGDCSEASADLLRNGNDSRAQVCLPCSSPLPMSSPSPIPLTTVATNGVSSVLSPKLLAALSCLSSSSSSSCHLLQDLSFVFSFPF